MLTHLHIILLGYALCSNCYKQLGMRAHVMLSFQEFANTELGYVYLAV
jgi:hypothetical protein